MNRYLLVFSLFLFSGLVSGNDRDGYEVAAVIYSKSQVVIASEVKGIVESILDVGTQFKKGDTLFKVDSAYEERLLVNYRHQKEFLTLKLKKQNVIAEGYVELKKNNSISDYLLFEKQVDVLNSQSEIERLKVEIEKLEDVLSKKSILAPYDGVVIERNPALFQRITVGNPIVAIYNPNTLYLKAFISASRVKLLELESVELSGFPDSQRAILDYVSPIVKQGSNTVEISFRLPEAVALIGESILIRFN